MSANAEKSAFRHRREELLSWLTDHAYPLWLSAGVAQDGGFEECLDERGQALPYPRRLRVLPRQIFAFTEAARLSRANNAAGVIRRGLAYLEAKYRRPDGLYRTLVSPSGFPMDDSALLYDHAFVLLAYTSAGQILDEMTYFESEAGKLWTQLSTRWRDGAGFAPEDEPNEVYLSNPLMHLLEACLEWSFVGASRWAARAAELANLAIDHLADPRTGAIFEMYTKEWRLPSMVESRRIIEPGHQFEWAWLLLRCQGERAAEYGKAAMRLIALAEQRGVENQFVVNEIWDDGSVRDGSGRLWPQTERLKANLLAYEITGQEIFAQRAAEATGALAAYLQTPMRGLWYDCRDAQGHFTPSPSPASTFYHLVCAISELASCRNLS